VQLPIWFEGFYMEKDSPLTGRKIAFVGKLGGTTRKEAFQIVRDQGGLPLERVSEEVDIIVLGADMLPSVVDESIFPDLVRNRLAHSQLELISETEFWHRLGLVEHEQNIRQLYTPAMLADLLSVSVREIRRWRKLGLIIPVKEIHRLPYFDYQEVVNARRLADLLAQGTSPQVIEHQLVELAKLYPDAERPLSQLSLLVEGKQILLRGEGRLIEPRGQLRIDFDSLDSVPNRGDNDSKDRQISLKYPAPSGQSLNDGDQFFYDRQQLLDEAVILEEQGDLEDAIACYRLILAHDGPSSDLCFQLAELLYRQGETSSACERYFMAVELDSHFVEARANLGCVLAELGQNELAVAVFKGALTLHPDYADVHHHLAEVLEELDCSEEAKDHWREFLRLTPNSPWAQEAKNRLE
jgi:tetratricopeptide (TPR) repeat protein